MIGKLAAELAICLAMTPTASFAMLWGVNGHPFTAYPGVDFETQLDHVRDLHARSYRVNISFAEEGAELGRLVVVAKERGVTILPVLTPGMINLGQDSTDQLYAKAKDFALALASQFKDDIPVWELGNEMENYAILQPCDRRDDGAIYPCDWGPAGGVDPLDYHGPRWAKVSAVLRGLSDGITAVDPGLRKAIGTAGWGHVGAFERIRNDGIQWDISVWHAYGADPEWAFEILQRYGRPIWVTEINYPLGSTDGEQAQADGLRRQMTRLIQLEERYDVEAAHVYELFDEPYWAPSFEAVMGLVPLAENAEGGWTPQTPKPAFDVVREIASGSNAVRACDLDAAATIEPIANRQAAYAHCVVFGVAATPSKLDTWATAIVDGKITAPELLESMIRSPEFRAQYGSDAMDDAEYIYRIYRMLLKREADGVGQSDYLAQLANGSLTREQLALALTMSDEFAGRHSVLFEAAKLQAVKTSIAERECDLDRAAGVVTPSERRASYAYCLLLGRDADAAEVSRAAGAIDGGASTAELLRSLAGSPEFSARHQVGGLGDPEYVALLYRLLLGREADGGGRDGYVSALASQTLRRDTMALAIAESQEFVDLHPALAAPEVTTTRMRLRDCDLEALGAMDEPAKRKAAYAYCLVLGTSAPPDVLERWSAALEGGTVRLDEIFVALVRSDDFANRYGTRTFSALEFVDLVYELMLGRDPDPVGLDSYLDQLAGKSMSREDVVLSTLGSGEFTARHQVLAR